MIEGDDYEREERGVLGWVLAKLYLERWAWMKILLVWLWRAQKEVGDPLYTYSRAKRASRIFVLFMGQDQVKSP